MNTSYPSPQWSEREHMHVIQAGKWRINYSHGHLQSFKEREPISAAEMMQWAKLDSLKVIIVRLPEPAIQALIEYIDANTSAPKTLAGVEAIVCAYRNDNSQALTMPPPVPEVDGSLMSAREVFAAAAEGKQACLMSLHRFLPALASFDMENFAHHLEEDWHDLHLPDIDARYAANYYHGEYIWDLIAVKYKDEPVMLIQIAGEDHNHRHALLLNKRAFKEMNNYIFSSAKLIVDIEDDEDIDIIDDLDEPREDTHTFDRHNLAKILNFKAEEAHKRELGQAIAKAHPHVRGQWAAVDEEGNILDHGRDHYSLQKKMKNSPYDHILLHVPA